MSKVTRHQSPLKETVRQLCEFLPGIDRLIYIEGDDGSGKWKACEWVKKGNDYSRNILEISEAVSGKLLDIRKLKSGYNWTDNENIPFYVEQGKNSISQLSLFSEEKYLTLVIRLKSKTNALSDLLYIFFRNDKSNFGISHDPTPVDTSQKSIIGMLTYNFANIIYSETARNNNEFSSLKSEFIDLLKFHTSSHDAGKKREFEEWKTDWAREVLAEISQRDGVNYVYREDALKMMVENDYPYRVLKHALEDAVRIASMFAGNDNEDIFIEKYFIKFTDVTFETGLETERTFDALPERMDKVYQFLERLENAAGKLLEDEIRPTSELVGKAMDEPITAPAIRDALKKNRIRVVKLLNRYPDKWKYIRSHFRPVLNILPNNNDMLNLNAG